MPASLSLAMIVKNEDQVLGRVLAQASRFCDELVIVDTGSTDGTVELARSFKARVFQFAWVDDFAAARNFAFAQCQGDWIIWLDADDVLTDEAVEKLATLKNTVLNDQLDAVVCSYQLAFSEEGECLISMPRERLLRRGCGGEWQFPIHEAYVLPDQGQYLQRLDIAIEHRKPAIYTERSVDRNLNMLARLIEEGDQLPRTWYYYGKELKHHARYEEAVHAFAKHASLNREDVISRYQAIHMGMTCLMALEKYDEAIEWGMQALQTDASRAEALTDLGVIYFRRQQFAHAIPLLTGATVASRPTSGIISEEHYTWRPYHYLSLCYEGQGEYAKAIEAALKAYPAIPDKQVILDNIRCFAAKLG